MSNSSIWPIHSTLSDDTSQGPSGPESDGNEEIFILQSSSITIRCSLYEGFLFFVKYHKVYSSGRDLMIR